MIAPLLIFLGAVSAAVWAPQSSGSDSELRGLAVLDATHAWASGSGGTVLRTHDGAHWEKLGVPGGETLDFRDLEALGEGTVLLMSAGPGDASRIYRSTDSGASWTLVHTNPDPDGFYDAMAFWDARNGLLFGDPVKGRFVVRVTADGGATWSNLPAEGMPEALPGEGAFAASGTCLVALEGGREAWFVTGGARVSRAFRSADRGRTWSVAETPVPAANASSGLFSVAFLDAKRGFAVGGDYKKPSLAGLNGARTEDGGKTWSPAPVSAAGFWSAVSAVPGVPSDLVSVGLAGSTVSHNAGGTWSPLDKTLHNAVAFAGAGTGWAVGPKGAIVKFVGGKSR